MKSFYLYIFGIIILLVSCNKPKEPNNFLNIKFGTTYEKAKKRMLSKGYVIHIEEPNQERISFTGFYEGFKTDLILLEMNDNHTLKEGWLNVVEDKDKFISFMKDKIIKQYKQTPDSYINQKGEIWKWEFPSYHIILGLTHQLGYYRVVKNNS